MIPDKVIKDWASNKQRIQERLNRINKRLKKYNKQKAHFEMRLKVIAKYEKTKDRDGLHASRVRSSDVSQDDQVSNQDTTSVAQKESV